MSVYIDVLNILHVVVLIIIYLLLYSDATDIQQVRFTKPDTTNITIDSGRRVDVLKNKPLEIVFEMFSAQSVMCMNADFYEASEVTKNYFVDYGNGTSLLKIPNVTASMNTKWNCNIQNADSGFINYLFIMRVKGTKKVRMEVSGTELEFTDTDLSVSGYDGVYKYEYEEGDFIDLTCSNINERGELGLRYNDANERQVFEHMADISVKQLRFQQSMRVQNSRSYVDCTYITPEVEYRLQYTYRTMFTIKNKPIRNDGFFVSINGTKLIPLQFDTNGRDLYRYMFIKGTMLDVTCERRDNQGSDITINIHEVPYGVNISVQDITPQQIWERRFLINTNDLNGVLVRCNSGNNVADIRFFADQHRELFVLGLRESDVLYRYSKTTEKWVTHYQYTVNEALSLICMTTGNKIPHWSKEIFKAHVEIVRTINETSYLYGSFLLTPEYDSTSITCNAKKYKSEPAMTIVLHQKPDLSTAELSALNVNKKGKEKENEMPIVIYVGYAIAASGAIISAIWTLRWWTKKKKSGPEQRAYQNIYEDINPIPAFPNQWNNYDYTYIQNECHRNENNENEYTYITNCNNNEDGVMVDNAIYCKTTEPCYAAPHRRTAGTSHTENHYTEIDDNFVNKIKSKHPIPYKKQEVNCKPSSNTETTSNSQEENRNKDLQREDSGGSYSNLLMGDGNKNYENIQSENNNANYTNLQETRQCDPKPLTQ